MAQELSVRIDDQRVGVLSENEHGRLAFAYTREWLASGSSRQVSLAMPLRAEPYDDLATRTFFEGFLPDDGQDLERIARHFGVSARSTFRLVRALGGDLAGALSIHEVDDPPERELDRQPDYEVLDEPGLAFLLRSLEREPLGAGPGGLRLSLAGAQSKTAVYRTEDGRLAKTRDDYPSSHIIKPELRVDVPDLALLEYFTLEVARGVGLDVPEVTYGVVHGVPYVLIERYDRIRHDDGRIERLHQEDFCQALGIPPQRKYQADRGPGLRVCFELLGKLRTPAVARLQLLDLVIFNWLVGNSDAHGKNFSILYAPDGARLAPAYDVVSVLVYEQDPTRAQDPRRAWDRNMAMRIGDARLATAVTPTDWAQFAKETGFAWPAIRRRIDELSLRVVKAAVEVERALADQSRTTPHFHRAVDLLIPHVERLRVKQGLGGFPEGAVPGRLKAVHVHEGLGMTDHVTVSATPDERRDYDTRYRQVMTRLHSAHDRARRAGRSEEDGRLGQLGRDLTSAFGTWHSGASLPPSQRDLLREHLGPLPGEPGSEPAPVDPVPPPAPHLVRGMVDARETARRIEETVRQAAGVEWPRVVILVAVPSRPLDLRDHMAMRDGPLQRLLLQPPRWRVGGFDLHAGQELGRAQGRILRVAAPGHGALDVWDDGALAAAFAPRLDEVDQGKGSALRLNGLELAERGHLFAEFANAVFALAEEQVDAALVGLRMRELHHGTPRLALGPFVPGTYGWQFKKELRLADANQSTSDAVLRCPLEAGRVAYQMVRDLHLAFGVTIDDLPYLDRDAGGAFVSKTRFLDFVERHHE